MPDDERGYRVCVGDIENGMLNARAVLAALRGKLRLQCCVDRFAAGQNDRYVRCVRSYLAREELAEPARAAGDEINRTVPPRHVVIGFRSLQLAPAGRERGASLLADAIEIRSLRIGVEALDKSVRLIGRVQRKQLTAKTRHFLLGCAKKACEARERTGVFRDHNLNQGRDLLRVLPVG